LAYVRINVEAGGSVAEHMLLRHALAEIAD
jgi:hypothetical protein